MLQHAFKIYSLAIGLPPNKRLVHCRQPDAVPMFHLSVYAGS